MELGFSFVLTDLGISRRCSRRENNKIVRQMYTASRCIIIHLKKRKSNVNVHHKLLQNILIIFVTLINGIRMIHVYNFFNFQLYFREQVTLCARS